MNDFLANRLAVLRIVGIYALVGCLWIYTSDTILHLLIQDSAIIVKIAIFKGSFYVIFTSLLLYFIINRSYRDLAASELALKHQVKSLLESEANLKQAEAALLNIRRLHEETERIGKIGGWEFNTETLEQTWTEEVYRIHEVDSSCKPTVADGINFSTPESRSLIEHAIQSAIEQGESFDIELEIITAKSNTKTIHAIGRADKEKRKVSGFIQDITDKKRAESALKQSDFFFKESQRAASIGSYHCDFIRGVWESSEVLETIFGIGKAYTRSIEGWLDIIHPDDREMMDTYLREEVKFNRNQFSKEYRVIRQNDGDTRWVYGLGKVSFDDENNALTMIGTIQDITDRKKVEQALQDERNLSMDIINTQPSGIYRIRVFAKDTWENDAWRSPDNSPHVVELASEPFYKILNVTREAFDNKPGMIIDLIYPDDRDGFSKRNEEAVARLDEFIWEGRLLIDGVIRWVRFQSLPRPLENGDVLWTGALFDITDRKKEEAEKVQLECRLNQAQKMEAIGQLAGGVAHDFNNKLMVIMGNADLVKMDVHTSNKTLHCIEQISRAAEQSREITSRLLAFSRQQVVTPQVLDANKVIAETLTSLSRLIGEHISISFEPNDELWNIRIDPVQLDQIVMNLAINARDAMPDGGAFVVEAHNTTYEISSSSTVDTIPGDYVMITFCDTGTGMDKNTLQRIFEPFFTTKEVGKGTGLGLATIYGIVCQSGGFIEVSSTIGCGTEFRVYIPRFTASKSEITKTAETLCAGNCTILFVEDEDAVRSVTSQFLRHIGYTVHEATTPRGAIDLAGNLSIQIDLVLTDFLMPGMNGKIMMEHIQELRPQLQCIYASGFTTEHVRLGDDAHFIQKPYNFIKLSGLLGRVLNGWQGQDGAN